MMYEKPKIEIISFLNEDIITGSGEMTLNDGFWGESGEGSSDWWSMGVEG